MSNKHSEQVGDAAIHPPMYVSSSDPGAKGAGKFWLDTAAGATLTAGAILKERDGTNSSWTVRADVKTALDLKAALASPTFTGTVTIPTPSPGDNSTKAASTAYVDGAVNTAITGLAWKQPVRAATTANGTLASAFANSQVVDGVTLATGDRILLKNQTTGSENGIYVVASSGAPTRATDADSGAELLNATVMVEEGTANADTQWTCSTNATITPGSTSLAFAQVGTSGASGSAGGDLAGTYPNPTIKSSVALAGSPTTTTQSPSDNSTKIATTAYVDAQVIGGSGALVTIHRPTTALFSLSNTSVGSFAINQGSTYYSIARSDTGGSSVELVCFQGKAVPAGVSWTATIGFWSTPYGRSTKCRAGLSLLESGTLKMLNLFHDTENGTPAYQLFAYANMTTFSSNPFSSAPIFGGRQLCFFRVSYDGTNYTFSISDNFGDTWTVVATLAKATYFTTAADRIGVALDTGSIIVAGECRMEIFYYSDPDF